MAENIRTGPSDRIPRGSAPTGSASPPSSLLVPSPPSLPTGAPPLLERLFQAAAATKASSPLPVPAPFMSPPTLGTSPLVRSIPEDITISRTPPASLDQWARQAREFSALRNAEHSEVITRLFSWNVRYDSWPCCGMNPYDFQEEPTVTDDTDDALLDDEPTIVARRLTASRLGALPFTPEGQTLRERLSLTAAERDPPWRRDYYSRKLGWQPPPLHLPDAAFWAVNEQQRSAHEDKYRSRSQKAPPIELAALTHRNPDEDRARQVGGVCNHSDHGVCTGHIGSLAAHPAPRHRPLIHRKRVLGPAVLLWGVSLVELVLPVSLCPARLWSVVCLVWVVHTHC